MTRQADARALAARCASTGRCSPRRCAGRARPDPQPGHGRRLGRPCRSGRGAARRAAPRSTRRFHVRSARGDARDRGRRVLRHPPDDGARARRAAGRDRGAGAARRGRARRSSSSRAATATSRSAARRSRRRARRGRASASAPRSGCWRRPDADAREPAAEALLVGDGSTSEPRARRPPGGRADIAPTGDIHGGAEYRRDLIGVMVRRALCSRPTRARRRTGAMKRRDRDRDQRRRATSARSSRACCSPTSSATRPG